MSKTLGSLPVGSLVKFGRLFGDSIVWQIGDKNHEGYPDNSVSLISRGILMLACFDAKESANSDSSCKNYGTNRYIYSNVRQWLNSAAAPGSWYTAQHSADAPPTSANVWSNHNPYDAKAGFLNDFTQQERDALLTTTHTVGKASVDGGGTEKVTDKIFLLSCTEVGLSGDAVYGTKWAIFSDNASRIAKPTAQCVANSTYTNSSLNVNSGWYYWLADACASSSCSARSVSTGGTLDRSSAYYGGYGVRPACNLSSSILVSDTTDADGCYTLIYNQPPTAPTSITVPNTVLAGTSLDIAWSAATDPEGTLSGYKLERSANGGGWSKIYSGAALKFTDTVALTGVSTLQYRVKAYDINGAESGYKVSGNVTVIHNKPPTITSDKTDELGTLTDGFTCNYSVNDEDAADNVTVTLGMDRTVISTFTAIKGQQYTYSLTGNDWLKVTNGSHTFKISATDGKETVENIATFTRTCNSLSTTLATALPANDIIKACSLDVMGIIPDDTVCLYEVTNNGNDSSPVWEDCTEKVKAGSAYIFKNKTAENGFAFNFRIKIQRGTSGEGGYINKVSGGFE